MIKSFLSRFNLRVLIHLLVFATLATASSSCDVKGDNEKTMVRQEGNGSAGAEGDDEKIIAAAVSAKNSALGEFTLDIQSSLEGENILWKNEQMPTQCDDVSRVDGVGASLKLANVDPSQEVIYICLYNKATQKALTDSALEIPVFHDISFQSTFSGVGPLSSVHSFSLDSLGLTFASALKGRTLEIYKTEEKVSGVYNAPAMILSKRLVLDKYYKKSVKFGDHLILFTAEEVDIIENFITSEDYKPVNLFKSELLLGDIHISGTTLIAVTMDYGISVYDLSDLTNVAQTHDIPLSRDINQSVLKGNYLYTSNYMGIVVYRISDLSNIVVVGDLNLSALFPAGDVIPMKFAVDTYDDSTVVFAYNKKSQYFMTLYVDPAGGVTYSTSSIETLYPNSAPGIMGIGVLPNDEIFI